MATIYRFIVEQKTTSGGGRKSSKESSGMSKKSTAKKGRYVSVLGGDKGGVEHNRPLRAINPLLNKMTGGYWEKGMRLGRAGAGLITKNTETGKIGISGPAIAIIIALAIQTALKVQNKYIEKANRMNKQNYKALENGFGFVQGDYDINVNFWTGRQTYNQNK